MGTLLGHVLPGSFFLFFALWRLLQINFRLRLVRLKNEKPDGLRPVRYFTSSTYPCCIEKCARFPTEGAIKILLTTIGMGGELFASTNYGHAGKIVYMGDLQHLTVYGFFCLSGIVDVLCWKRVRFCPPGIDFLALAGAFVVQWMLFSHHLHGRSSIDVTLHTLLLYVIAANVLAIVAEYRWNESLMTSLAMTYLLMVQGTWFIQVGVILYVRWTWTAWIQYDMAESDQTMMATAIFAWHLGGNFLLALTLFTLIGYLMRFSCGGQRIENLWEAHTMSSSIDVTTMTRVTSASRIDIRSDTQSGVTSDEDIV